MSSNFGYEMIVWSNWLVCFYRVLYDGLQTIAMWDSFKPSFQALLDFFFWLYILYCSGVLIIGVVLSSKAKKLLAMIDNQELTYFDEEMNGFEQLCNYYGGFSSLLLFSLLSKYPLIAYLGWWLASIFAVIQNLGNFSMKSTIKYRRESQFSQFNNNLV